MSKESLIQELIKAKCDCRIRAGMKSDIYREGFNDGIEKAIAILQIHHEAEQGKRGQFVCPQCCKTVLMRQEADACDTCLQRRKISLRDVVAKAFEDFEGKPNPETDDMDIYDVILHYLRPYLRTTELSEDLLLQRFNDGKRLGALETEDRLRKPVLVDLGRCVAALDAMWVEGGRITLEQSAKAVLDAAGVKYDL